MGKKQVLHLACFTSGFSVVTKATTVSASPTASVAVAVTLRGPNNRQDRQARQGGELQHNKYIYIIIIYRVGKKWRR
jgi:hypothetical protein